MTLIHPSALTDWIVGNGIVFPAQNIMAELLLRPGGNRSASCMSPNVW